MISRRGFVAMAPLLQTALAAGAGPRLGVDLFSVRSQKWTPFESLDYCARLGAKLVHFSELPYLGSLDEANLRRVKDHAAKLGLAIEVGTRTCCPTSKAFDPKLGTGEEQMMRAAQAAHLTGSPIVRTFMGTFADRDPSAGGPIDRHVDAMAALLKSVRSRLMDLGLKVAIENHAGDMQARELKSLVEVAGKDFVGVCLDSGNPLWALEDPHLTLETLYPYVLTTHCRDTAVWRVPEGAAVAWVRMGDGNVGIREYISKLRQLRPDLPVTLEIIVTNGRVFPYHDPKFWEPYKNQPAWEFARFVKIAEAGHPREPLPQLKGDAALQRERQDLEESFTFTRNLLNV
ncbi:MAG TPA: sugar phosphate isomerase/epimerase [Bryobacteraceae bacterium]|nr:sugar phosphate isomerase/epimerase [Bryobacteraceae bacterium]